MDVEGSDPERDDSCEEPDEVDDNDELVKEIDGASTLFTIHFAKYIYVFARTPNSYSHV